MMNQKALEELESLLIDWESGDLELDGIHRVRELLRSSHEARAFYVRRQVISAALMQEVDAGLSIDFSCDRESASPVERSTQVAPSVESGWLSGRVLVGLLVFAASLLIVALVGRIAYLENQPGGETVAAIEGPVPDSLRQNSAEATSNGVALLTRTVDVKWPVGQDSLDAGDALQPGLLRIKSGLAQIEFFCGATLVVEGPAELDLKSAMFAHVLSGRLRAQVPPAARGFAVQVAEMKVVDLGTEFAIGVTSEGADVQVFDGEVELHQPEERKQLLTTGQAITRSHSGKISRTDATPSQFVSIAGLESEARSQNSERFERWQTWSSAIRKDPRLIAYYSFDQSGGSRRLRCDGAGELSQPKHSELDGAIVGAAKVDGRWPGKDALEFKRPGDRVRVQVPGEYGSLTLACWVRIDSLDRWYNSLFLTDNYNQGEPHWQILDTGQLYFSVRPAERETAGPKDQKILSSPFWKPSMSGKWMHLAVTYDVENQVAAHYLDGMPIHEEAVSSDQLVTTTRIGAATIGNWSVPTMPEETFAIRNLNGRIDEFIMFSDALSATEIKDIYDNGKP